MLQPLPPQLWDPAKAAHLLNRAGFGGTPAEIEAAHAKTLPVLVHELIEARAQPDELPAPDWTAHPENIRAMRQEIRALKNENNLEQRQTKERELRRLEGEHLLDLRRWWLERMMKSSVPLLEKMTLFWHGHFATSAQKVEDPYWIFLQNQTLRTHALGNFATLTKAISRDPAMMIYLDLQQSRREHPNENWARELMELFTLGIGNYTEPDIRESARAFTGYRVDNEHQQFRYAVNEHDAGPKKFLGASGPWHGDDIIDLILKQPACAEFIARKIWRFFVEDEPPRETVRFVADRLRQNKYELRPVLHEIFESAEFYTPRAMRSQIKSPVQYLVQTSKLLETELPPVPAAQNAMRQMGQILFAPPNVKGWDGGKAWVSTSTLLFRYNFADYLVRGDSARPNRERAKGFDPAFRPAVQNAANASRPPVDLAKLAPPELREKPDELIASLSARLFQTPLPARQTAVFADYLRARQPEMGDETIYGLLHLMMSTPQFQLT